MTAEPVNIHVLLDDDPGLEEQHRARCSCGWVSDPLWSRRRASEAGRGHLRAP